MKLKELCSYLESEVPLSLQEDYDNSGLQLGSPDMELSSALLTLDITEDVIDEAINKKCDIIISHHPLIFKGILRITGNTSAERVITKAIRHDIAIYSSHTNLDIFSRGVSQKMAEKLGLMKLSVLSPLEKSLLKLVTYIPESHLDVVRNALFEAGAGVIGNYDNCSFAVEGTGSFRGGENSNPFIGEKGKINLAGEIRFETVLHDYMRGNVLKALIEAHPYEEVAYDLFSLENINPQEGLGCLGELEKPLIESEFLKLVSVVFDSKGVRYSRLSGKEVRKVALCGGSGASLIKTAISVGADAFVTADIKYHDFLDAENKILLVDSGHFESEKHSTEILYDLIIKKFPKFAVRFSETNRNPINYL